MSRKAKELQASGGNSRGFLSRKAQAVNLRQEGYTRREIAHMMSVHIKTVNRYLGDGNYRFFKPDAPVAKPSPADFRNLATLRDSYEPGDTQSSLVRKTGLAASTVNRAFKIFKLNEEFGIDEALIRRKMKEGSRKGMNTEMSRRKARSEALDDNIRALIEGGKGTSEIASATNRSARTVYKHIAESPQLGQTKQEIKMNEQRQLINAILKAMETCNTQKEIAEATGISYGLVSKLCRENDLWAVSGRKRKNPAWKPDAGKIEERDARILAAYDPGLTAKQISGKCRVSLEVVAEVLKEKGLETKPYDFEDRNERMDLVGRLFESHNRIAVLTHFVNTPKGWRAVIANEPFTAVGFSKNWKEVRRT